MMPADQPGDAPISRAEVETLRAMRAERDAKEKSARDHAKRNRDSRNHDRAAHWTDVSDAALLEADALAKALRVLEMVAKTPTPVRVIGPYNHACQCGATWTTVDNEWHAPDCLEPVRRRLQEGQ